MSGWPKDHLPVEHDVNSSGTCPFYYRSYRKELLVVEDKDVAYSGGEEDLDAYAAVHDDALVVHEAYTHDALVGEIPGGAYDRAEAHIRRMGDARDGDDPVVELQVNENSSDGHNPCTNTVHFRSRAHPESTLPDGEKHSGCLHLVDWGIVPRVVSSCLVKYVRLSFLRNDQCFRAS